MVGGAGERGGERRLCLALIRRGGSPSTSPCTKERTKRRGLRGACWVVETVGAERTVESVPENAAENSAESWGESVGGWVWCRSQVGRKGYARELMRVKG